MKRLIYIFIIFLALTSCARVETEIPGTRQVVDGMLLVDFKIDNAAFQSYTKSGFGLLPEIRSLKVVVFDDKGVYISQSDADITTSPGYYSAYFPVSAENDASDRAIHFIANYDKEIEYGTELEVISKLVVDDGTDCYWQRIVVNDLIAHNDPGTGNMLLSSEVVEQLNGGDGNLATTGDANGIQLIRNFCAFEVSTAPSSSGLEILQAEVYNVPTKGTVAPYSSKNSSFVGGNGFVSNYQTYTSPENLINDGYKAAVPLDYALTTHHGEALKEMANSVVTLFSYERELPQDNPPFILVKGYYNGSPTPTFYKINLRDVNDDYFPLLRNFKYLINIKKAYRAGYATAEEAIASAGSGDVSTDIRYGSLTEISNGEAKMMISHTDVVLVTGDPFEVKYQFIPNLDHPGTINNDSVTIKLGEPGTSGAVFNTPTGTVTSNSVINKGSSDSDGWRTITVNPEEPGQTVRTQSLTITGNYILNGEDLTISRTVNFTLRQKPVLTIQCLDNSTKQATNLISNTKETPFIVKIGIPDGLPSSMFPLELSIEARKGTITPNTGVSGNNLPVVTGKSMFDNTKPGYHFIKSLQYSDYETNYDYENNPVSNGYKYFYAYFKTNIAQSSTDIMVDCNNFVSAYTYFKNNASEKFEFSNLSLHMTDENNAVLSFYMPTAGNATINLNNAITPSGKNAGRMSGSNGTYTYSPESSGVQEIGIALNGVIDLSLTLSSSGYNTNRAEYSPYYWTMKFNKGIKGMIYYNPNSSGSKLLCGEVEDSTEPAYRWTFKPAASNNQFYIKSYGSQMYIQKTSSNNTNSISMGDDTNYDTFTILENNTNGEYFSLSTTTSKTYSVKFSITDSYMNRYGGGIVAGVYNTYDDGSKVTIARHYLEYPPLILE